MKIVKLSAAILVIPLAVAMFVYAGIDDSPGGQLIGVVVGVIGIVSIVKIVKK